MCTLKLNEAFLSLLCPLALKGNGTCHCRSLSMLLLPHVHHKKAPQPPTSSPELKYKCSTLVACHVPPCSSAVMVCERDEDGFSPAARL